eukprot:1586777-Pleurochrysis_carterae.AAC.2
MPSGRVKGPENRSNTRREVLTAEARAVGARWRGAGTAGSVIEGEGAGSPWFLSELHGLAMAWSATVGGSQGKDLSLNYTSDATTIRFELGAQIL